MGSSRKVALTLPSLSILGTEMAVVDRTHPSVPPGPKSSAGTEPVTSGEFPRSVWL